VFKEKGLWSLVGVEKIHFTNHKGFFLLLEGVGGFCCFAYIGKEREERAPKALTHTYIQTKRLMKEKCYNLTCAFIKGVTAAPSPNLVHYIRSCS